MISIDFTPTERDLLYKFANLIEKYNLTDWSLYELSIRWKVAKKTLVTFFSKLKEMGFLIEIRDHYHEVWRALTHEALELVKSGAFYIKNLFEKRVSGNRSETDRKPINFPVRNDCNPLENKELMSEEKCSRIHNKINNILNDNENSFVQDDVLRCLDRACLMRFELQTEQIKALALENYKTYNKAIENPSRFMNNCIDRSLDLVNRIEKPCTERNEPQRTQEPLDVPEEPTIKVNAIPEEVKTLHGKTLSNGFKVRVFPTQINVFKGIGENLEFIEIKITDLDFHKKIEEKIKPYVSEN